MERTVAKAFKLLEALAAHDQPQRVTELARELGMVKSNVFRLLRTLIALGYVHQGEDGLYAATLRVWEVGTRALSHVAVQRIAGDHIKRLAATTGEAVNLAILDGPEVLFLGAVETIHAIRLRSVIGYRAPACSSATGKALLAHQSDDVVRVAFRHAEEVLPRSRFETTWERFKAELAEVRRQGYAVNLSSWRVGVHAVGAPIALSDGTMIAAISVTGPAERLVAKRVRVLGPQVVETANAIANDLAYAATAVAPAAEPTGRLGARVTVATP
jgi:DNA-binding IclR family transcriptional regulator